MPSSFGDCCVCLLGETGALSLPSLIPASGFLLNVLGSFGSISCHDDLGKTTALIARKQEWAQNSQLKLLVISGTRWFYG